MTTRALAAGTLVLLSTGVLAAFQMLLSPVSLRASEPASQLSTPDRNATVLVGCLYRETLVSGDPNGLDAYILADATVPITGPYPPGSAPHATGTSGRVPTSGNMYRLDNILDFRLDAFVGLVGLRVEVTGTIDAEEAWEDDHPALPEFEAETIRAVAGSCPPTPAPRERP